MEHLLNKPQCHASAERQPVTRRCQREIFLLTLRVVWKRKAVLACEPGCKDTTASFLQHTPPELRALNRAPSSTCTEQKGPHVGPGDEPSSSLHELSSADTCPASPGPGHQHCWLVVLLLEDVIDQATCSTKSTKETKGTKRGKKKNC